MDEFVRKFTLDFIEKERWRFITNGLKVTLIVTIAAAVIGIIIGMIIAVIRCAHDQQDKNKLKGFGGFMLKLGNLPSRKNRIQKQRKVRRRS